MAIISIPTSIGGVSIPGGLLDGPLGALFGNSKTLKTLQYPADLSSNPARAHMVQFAIKQVNGVNLLEKTDKFAAATGDAAVAAQQAYKNTSINPDTPMTLLETSVGKLVNSGTSALSKGFGSLFKTDNIKSALQPPTTKLSSIISLYMPDTLNMSYNATWSDFDLTAAGGTAGAMAQGAADYVQAANKTGLNDTSKNGYSATALLAAGKALNKLPGVSQMDDVLLKSGGYAVNPQLQLLYKGVGLREFQLEFIFTPKTKAESDSVKNIIEMFTLHFLPSLQGAAGGNEGQFFVMPSIFNIQFMFASMENGIQPVINSILGNLGAVGQAAQATIDRTGKGTALASILPGNSPNESKYLYKVGDCVLENITTDYAPSGWATYADGSPIQTRMTLQFKEMNIMHRGIYGDKPGNVR